MLQQCPCVLFAYHVQILNLYSVSQSRSQWQIERYFAEGIDLYNELIREGVAKECARFVLPLATPTRIYMTGSVRSWIHYIDLRSAHGTQKEHMDIAEACRQIFIEQFPSHDPSLHFSYPEIVRLSSFSSPVL